uniref:C-type lectin domain-containing protein n=1 Tax=Podarcis muralis TaxID=64176 RepID=A0A670IRX4_PODMU
MLERLELQHTRPHLASWFFLLPENSDCKLCPENWQRHGDKCYWISREKGTWNKSQNDCAAKDSQLAVIQKQVELVSPD